MSSSKRSRVIPGPRRSREVRNLVCISDIHAGCKLAVCPQDGIRLDDGGRYVPSEFQLKLAVMWDEFWDDWVPWATKGEPYDVVINGDAVEGDHHRASTPISVNPVDQCRVAEKLLTPKLAKCEGTLYLIRGTEAHVGISAREEERLAERLGAKPNKEGQFCRWDLRKRIGNDKLLHFLHHVGVTGSQAYEATAVHKELVEMYTEAARWCQQPPDIAVRSHRHRNIEIIIPTGTVTGQTSRASIVVTPGWQGKTPHVYKIPGGRINNPQFGGIVIRLSDDGVLYTMSKVWTVEPSEIE